MDAPENEFAICCVQKELVDEAVVDEVSSGVLGQALHTSDRSVVVLAANELSSLSYVGSGIDAPPVILYGEVDSMEPKIGCYHEKQEHPARNLDLEKV